MSDSNTNSRPLTITFNDKKELYKSYMSFIKGGGVFIPNHDTASYKMNNKVFVIMKIKDEKTQLPVSKTFTGLVVWISPSGPNLGIGVSFGEAGSAIKDYIETCIVGVSGKADLVSYTI